MGWLFNKNKQEVELLRLAQENLTVTQKNLELIQSYQSKAEEPAKLSFDDDSKRQAAYVLNFCTVSVSQIVDYNDIYVLEQEYEAILNNLNLEKIPKDEALLNILKELLNTITFFRIQEDQKKLFEEAYQHNVKNAIWNAVPNLNFIVSGGAPAILGALAVQVGTGYMNYRKAKSENEWTLNKQNRQLLQTAMEQFHALRRELFETAWRLADKYNFPDEYRLTERQITQYNQILTDPDYLRRYERLLYVKDNFEAYPPFWYHLGHAAHAICIDEYYDLNIRSEYKAHAISHFRKFMEVGKYNILREDQIAASCALEFFNLTDDISEKRKHLQCAQKYSGNALDVMQHCALMYISIGDVNEAVEILKMLVNEEYNTKLNAQLLSRIYVYQAVENQKLNCRVEYKLLQERMVNRENHSDNLTWLYPMPNPESPIISPEQFIDQQRTELLDQYADFLCEYYSVLERECFTIFNESEEKASVTMREKLLVDFSRRMMANFALIPYAGIGSEKFIELLRDNRVKLENLAKSYSNKAFEDVFGVLFLTAAKNIATTEIKSMAQLSDLEMGLYQIDSLRKHNATTMSITSNIDNIAGLLNLDCERSKKFKAIKELVKKAQYDLLKNNSKHTEVLIEGSIEFNRYIQDHELTRNDIVAIINDRSLSDCDLLITEHRLEIHRWRSAGLKCVTAMGAGALAGTVAGAATLLVAPGANLALSAGVAGGVVSGILNDDTVLVKRILYKDIDHGTNKLKKISYSNKDVDTIALFTLLDDIRGLFEGSVEDKIRCEFTQHSKKESHSIPELVGYIADQDLDTADEIFE